MRTELPEIEIPGPEGWDIQEESRNSPTHRHFKAQPKERLVVDYVTWEKYRGRLIDVVAPAEVLLVSVAHYWNEDKQAWTSHPNIRVRLLNPRTMKSYSLRNPMSGTRDIRESIFNEPAELPTSREKIERVIVEATVPKTKIIVTITEEPLSA